MERATLSLSLSVIESATKEFVLLSIGSTLLFSGVSLLLKLKSEP
ncbi:hypothetical protein AVDCRST_MAG94-84 [uncultured Leptolyngbya sp.]|uniref:Uncharacterized protein n=1 Tax=uncultured Leptolyngbya sp. TaxID=332963 RepID=A0A6J4K5X8_9CYAN|nr:hypothetical protein AVDCRST_MAG94-84 [uncultured Leptolyngbya sp.]